MEQKPRPTNRTWTAPIHVYIKGIRVFEEGYLSRCLGSLSEESAEQTAFLLQRTENTLKQISLFDSRKSHVVRPQVFSLTPVYRGSRGDSRRVSRCVCHYDHDSPCSQTGCRCWPRARRAATLHPKCKKFTHTVSAAMCGHDIAYCCLADVLQEPYV